MGQATVELVALLPLLVALVLGAAQLLAAGAAQELAAHAAEAGAVALLEGGNPRDAARAALPGWADDRVAVDVDGRHVHVELRPPSPVPALGDALTAASDADAGGSGS